MMIKEEKHTQGPWSMRLSNNATPYITHGKCADGTDPDIDDLPNRICVMPSEISQSYNSFPNARLIAAAPELLDACQLLLVCMKLAGWEGDYAAERGREAIAKALGERNDD